MGARLVHALSNEGVALAIGEDGKLIVESLATLTDTLRQFIREHKAELMAELQAANDDGHAIESESAQELAPVLCLACQHYRFGYDHMGNVARCMSSGGFRGELIERPEQRRECLNYSLFRTA